MWPSIARISEQLELQFAASRHTTTPISQQLAQDCLQMTAVRIEPQPESYKSTLTTRHLHLHRQVGVNTLAQSCYLVVHWLGIEPWTFRSHIKRPNR